MLIVDGVNNHDWQTATRELRGILEAAGRFHVEISTSPPATAPPEEWARWEPSFDAFDAVVVNFNGGHKEDSLRWPPRVEAAFEAFVRRGGGVVIFHAANNAFLRWEAYNRMIGLGWRDRSFGPGLRIDSRGKPERIPAGQGLNPGHGPRHDFVITVAAPDHPITRGLPRRWPHPAEQLTHGQHGPAEGLTVLTCAWSKDSGQNEPMDWVRRFGKGRVYTTMLGHTWRHEDNPNLRAPGFRTLFARGVEWAATGRVTIPVPAAVKNGAHPAQTGAARP